MLPTLRFPLLGFPCLTFLGHVIAPNVSQPNQSKANRQTLAISETPTAQSQLYLNSEKPQIAKSAATTRPTHDAFMEMECGPICTVQRL